MKMRFGKSIHMIGIGGSGLSAIARLLLESGYQVSGSDRQASPVLDELKAAGAQIELGHAPEHIAEPDWVIRSSAIPDENPEVVAARRKGIAVLKRADFLGELMADKVGIAIAGSHGKTTTTAMVAWVLTALGQDPTFIIGGVARNLGVNARAGKGDHFIIEADEYDRMFHGLRPSIAVITNIEHDHPDCYPTEQDFYQAFSEFARLLRPQGCLVLCVDDPGAARLASELPPELKTVTYGIEAPEAQVRAVNLCAQPAGGYSFEVQIGDQVSAVQLSVPGVHNVRNALAALLVAHRLGLELGKAAQALKEFSGVGRRFEVKGEARGVTVIDDYGHHPTEIRATLAAARARYPGRRLWAVWQPHTFSRTLALADAFAQAFVDADCILVTEVFASREQPPAGGYSARQVVQGISQPCAHFAPDLKQAWEFLIPRLQGGDVLIVFSAGDADQISQQVLKALRDPGHSEPTRLGEKEQCHA